MAQTAIVLPSNAPPLRDNAEQSRIALQDRQQVYHQPQHHQLHHHHHHQPLHVQTQTPLNVYDHPYKAPQAVGVLGSNYLARAPTLPTAYYGQPQTFEGPWTRTYDFDRDARIRVDKLWEQLYQRALMCQKYQEYRGKQTKDNKISSDKVWPDVLEVAFFKALLYWPPMGRRKLMHKEKQRGRNELIADVIQELTGRSRTRKQVSSHIQVLIPFLEQDEIIMKWLSDKNDKEKDTRHAGPYSSSYTSGRLRSTYQQANRMQIDQPRQPSRNDIRAAKMHLNIFEPVEFKLFVQPRTDVPRSSHTEDTGPLHIYSRSIQRPMTVEQHIPDWQHLKQEYPVLAQMHASRPIDCNVISVEASLAMPTSPWRSSSNNEIAIILGCISRQILGGFTKVRCTNRFYKSGKALPPDDEDKDGTGEVTLVAAESGDKSETWLKFGSRFWVQTLNPGSTLARTIMLSAQAEPEKREKMRQSVDAHMRCINATQEISIPTTTGLETVLIMHWSFRLSSSEVGSTVWRQVHLPSACTQQPSVKAEPTSAISAERTFDFNAPIEPVVNAATPAVCGASAPTNYPALQSPFEYDSASGSAPSPATWPTTVSTSSSTNTRQNNMNSAESANGENAYDMPAQSMMMYDSNMNMDAFDTTAFSFDVNADNQFTSADGEAIDMQTYAQQWSASDYAASFETSQWQNFATQPSYNVQYEPQPTQHSNRFEGYEDFQKHAQEQIYTAATPATTAAPLAVTSIPVNNENASNTQQAYAGAAMSEREKDDQTQAWSAMTSVSVQ